MDNFQAKIQVFNWLQNNFEKVRALNTKPKDVFLVLNGIPSDLNDVNEVNQYIHFFHDKHSAIECARRYPAGVLCHQGYYEELKMM